MVGHYQFLRKIWVPPSAIISTSSHPLVLPSWNSKQMEKEKLKKKKQRLKTELLEYIVPFAPCYTLPMLSSIKTVDFVKIRSEAGTTPVNKSLKSLHTQYDNTFNVLKVIPVINLPLYPSFLCSLATPALLQYKMSACKLRFVCTHSVLQIAQAVGLPFL